MYAGENTELLRSPCCIYIIHDRHAPNSVKYIILYCQEQSLAVRGILYVFSCSYNCMWKHYVYLLPDHLASTHRNTTMIHCNVQCTMYTTYLSSNRCAFPGALSVVWSVMTIQANRLCLRGIAANNTTRYNIHCHRGTVV